MACELLGNDYLDNEKEREPSAPGNPSQNEPSAATTYRSSSEYSYGVHLN